MDNNSHNKGEKYETGSSNRGGYHPRVCGHRPMWVLTKKYAFDPLFALCAVGYVINSTYLIASRENGTLADVDVFVKNHLNDLFAIPVLLVVVIAICETFDRNTAPLSFNMVMLHTLMATLLWEVVCPSMGRGVADPIDAVCYFVGAMAFIAHHRIPFKQPVAK